MHPKNTKLLHNTEFIVQKFHCYNVWHTLPLMKQNNGNYSNCNRSSSKLNVTPRFTVSQNKSNVLACLVRVQKNIHPLYFKKMWNKLVLFHYTKAFPTSALATMYRYNLIDDNVVVFECGFRTLREVIFKRVDNAVEELDHKQWRNCTTSSHNLFVSNSIKSQLKCNFTVK